jgi:hypothetical protein
MGYQFRFQRRGRGDCLPSRGVVSARPAKELASSFLIPEGFELQPFIRRQDSLGNPKGLLRGLLLPRFRRAHLPARANKLSSFGCTPFDQGNFEKIEETLSLTRKEQALGDEALCGRGPISHGKWPDACMKPEEEASEPNSNGIKIFDGIPIRKIEVCNARLRF